MNTPFVSPLGWLGLCFSMNSCGSPSLQSHSINIPSFLPVGGETTSRAGRRSTRSSEATARTNTATKQKRCLALRLHCFPIEPKPSDFDFRLCVERLAVVMTETRQMRGEKYIFLMETPQTKVQEGSQFALTSEKKGGGGIPKPYSRDFIFCRL